MRVGSGAAGTEEAIRGILTRVWGPDYPGHVFRFSDVLREATTDYRARSVVLGLIALLCLPVTMVGVAGALNFATGQRVREIAIELAIGAEPRDIRRRVVRRALAAAGLAIVAGLGLGALTAGALSAFLFGVSPVDRTAVLASSSLIIGVAWISALLPARRAGRISPTLVLRE